VHTINNYGNPDTLIIDPIGSYRMTVHTIPPIQKDSIVLVAGTHNVIAVDAAQGHLNLKVAGKEPTNCIVRKKGEMETLHIQEMNSVEKYLVGRYDLEILTRPRILLEDVDISQSKHTTIEIQQSGSVTITRRTSGPGSIYLEDKNKLIWVYNLNPDVMSESISLQPGKYRVEFRPKNARESIYTIERRFKIQSGNSTVVNLY
jgi:Ca-activated chloride channel family protein